MILVELEIENYKQFAGLHRFTPQPSGVVGIIGANGAGKTTLFEAIEWCLYQPREIRSDEIPPRGNDALRPRVRLVLANPVTGAIYEIERVQKKAAASAEIVEISPGAERAIIATGSSTVTGYTTSRLIGLEHKAFVATFFTRQKELSFFGTLKPTDRRREVGRLLGLETIRQAQERIAEERTLKRNAATALLGQYEHESGQRDFPAEREAAFKRLKDVDDALAELSTALIAAQAAYRDASNQRSKLVEEREAALQLKSLRDQRDLQRIQAEASIAAATRELERIAALEAERPALAEQAGRVEQIGVRVIELEVDKARADQLASLRERLGQTVRERQRSIGNARAAMVPDFAPWSAMTVDDADPVGSLDRLVDSGAGVDASHTEARLSVLTQLLNATGSLAICDERLTRFSQGLEQIEEKLRQALAGGDPAEREQAAAEARNEAIAARGAHLASIDAFRGALVDLRAITDHDHTDLEGTICPTCLRSFTPQELEQSRAALTQRAADIDAQIARLTAESHRLAEKVAAIEADLGAVQTARDEIANLRARVDNGQRMLTETRQERDGHRAVVDQLHAHLGADIPVTDEERERLTVLLSVERRVEAALPILRQFRQSLIHLAAQEAELTAAIEEIGPLVFDHDDLIAARAEQDAARAAIERLKSIDATRERRPEHEQAIAEAERARTAAIDEIAGLDAHLENAPLDEFALVQADITLEQKRQDEQAIQTRIQAQRRIRDEIDRDLNQIAADENRLAAVAARAEEARVEADDLDRMYKEFNAFEQYVARRVRPQLEDMTSELVRVITENKYESVELDDDYGVRVWDGDVGNYPIEHFSGGERDVISLSARLALSRLIGSQAANPPSFMVMDEVFGSLDRDRRSNVLDLLSSLAGSAESFQQLFVISHVDDVRLSPAFTEVWKVVEAPDGSSRLENLNLSQGFDDV